VHAILAHQILTGSSCGCEWSAASQISWIAFIVSNSRARSGDIRIASSADSVVCSIFPCRWVAAREISRASSRVLRMASRERCKGAARRSTRIGPHIPLRERCSRISSRILRYRSCCLLHFFFGNRMFMCRPQSRGCVAPTSPARLRFRADNHDDHICPPHRSDVPRGSAPVRQRAV
jgi:hypothetical protein